MYVHSDTHIISIVSFRVLGGKGFKLLYKNKPEKTRTVTIIDHTLKQLNIWTCWDFLTSQ